MDLHGCNSSLFNETDVDRYLTELCVVIDMEKVAGQQMCWAYDGDHEHLKGISVAQFIKTSSITMHFSDSLATVWVNIFSCKDFNADIAKVFTENWFKGTAGNVIVIERN